MRNKKGMTQEDLDYLTELASNTTKDELVDNLILRVLQLTQELYKHELAEQFEECAAYKDIIELAIHDVKGAMDMFFMPTSEDYTILDSIAENALKIIIKNHKNK